MVTMTAEPTDAYSASTKAESKAGMRGRMMADLKAGMMAATMVELSGGYWAEWMDAW